MLISGVRAAEFIQRAMPLEPGAAYLGVAGQTGVIAAAQFHHYNGVNIDVDVVVADGATVPPRFVREVFDYAFGVCKAQRATAFVECSNLRSMTLCRKAGWEREATLHGAASDGGGLAVWVMRPEKCRYWRKTDGKQE